MSKTKTERYLTSGRVAEMLGVTRQTIWNWRQLEDDPLPTADLIGVGGEEVMPVFEAEQVKAWAKRNRERIASAKRNAEAQRAGSSDG